MPDKNCKGHEHHLCKLHNEKLHQKDPVAYARLVRNPDYVCKNCGRVAVGQEHLCAPVKLGTFED